MRIAAVAHLDAKRRDEALSRACKAFALECEKLGHKAEALSSADRPARKLTDQEYLVVFARAFGSFGTKVDPRLGEYLKNAGMLAGKRGCAVLMSRGPFKERGLRALMKAMEAEGIVVTYSDYLSVAQEAPLIARKLFEES